MERTSGIAVWRQIELLLEGEIKSGAWKTGDRLPTETDLAIRFGVNRHTLRRAMAALEASGMVRIEQGRGTFVQEDLVSYPVSKRTRYSENILLTNRQPGGKLLRSAEVPADRDVAMALGLRPKERVLMIDL
ncbi:MAG: GntR family transcriptional regulator, partial [Prosthecobacter sp.]|nr:GntR family transcriptional regulator [Prosthecobacter sp.]